MDKSFIGLDFGSDSVRALLVDAHGNEIAEAVRNYPRWSRKMFCDAARYCFRQHPRDYLETMTEVIRAVLQGQDADRVAGIGVDTTGSTPCAVDARGVPLAMHERFSSNPNAMFILWKDHTAMAEEQSINHTASRWKIDHRMYSGGNYSCEWFWSKLLYVLRNDQAVREAACSFVEHCDWISGVLTGNTRPEKIFRSRCAAGHKAMWHEMWGGLPDEDFLTAVDPLLAGWRDKLYRNTVTAGTRVGTLAPEWAAKLGLRDDTAVGAGAIDCHVGAVGAGITPGEMVKVLGTSTCDILAAGDPHVCIEGICGQVDGSVLPGLTGFEAGQAAFGDIYNWFKNFLEYAGQVDLSHLERDAAALPIGAVGVTALDWFNGRRTPFANSHLTGLIANLNLGTTPAMVYRALIESTVMGSKAIFDHFQHSGIAIKGITAVGGISVKSEFIMQMLADVFNMPIKVAKTSQSCALGAAMIGAAAAGEYADLNTASRLMNSGFRKIYTPQPENYEAYQKVYERRKALGAVWEKHICQDL